MESFWTAFFGILAAAWIIGGLRMVRGMARVPRLGEVSPLPDADCPAVSILVPARNEAAKLPQALPTLLAQDYPRSEVIVVNDRSSDATGAILEEFASQNENLSVHHLRELPAGWLGKPHALEVGYQHATGEWLVFTDADVCFAPDLLRRALALAREKGWDHLTLLPMVDLEGFWEKTALSFWGMGLIFGSEAWRVSNPRSRSYLGVGAFQLLRRSAYEAIGTHRRLALEVVDDIKLGKLVKLSRLRSGVAVAGERLRLRWQEGLLNLIRGLTKNSFAACGFRVRTVAAHLLRVFAFSILPFLALLFTSGTPRVLAAVSVVAAIAVHASASPFSRVSLLYGFTHPLGALVMCYILLRSAIVTLWHGGVVWRNTFYPLEELRKGLV